jgi:hypothetical protein
MGPSSRTLARALAAAALLGGTGTGCAAPVDLTGPVARPAHRPRLPPHREIQEVVILVGGRAVSAVAHLAVHESGEVRVHVGTDTGLTGVDVGVRRGETRVYSENPWLGRPGMGSRVAADLERVFGDRSLFCAAREDSPPPMASAAGELALPLGDGSFALVRPEDLAPGAGEVRVLLLDGGRIPEARIVYSDFGADGIPRSVTLADLRDGHRLEIEVVEVRPPAAGAP